MLYAIHAPYEDEQDDFLQTTCQFQIFFTYFIGMLILAYAQQSEAEDGQKFDSNDTPAWMASLLIMAACLPIIAAATPILFALYDFVLAKIEVFRDFLNRTGRRIWRRIRGLPEEHEKYSKAELAETRKKLHDMKGIQEIQSELLLREASGEFRDEGFRELLADLKDRLDDKETAELAGFVVNRTLDNDLGMVMRNGDLVDVSWRGSTTNGVSG